MKIGDLIFGRTPNDDVSALHLALTELHEYVVVNPVTTLTNHTDWFDVLLSGFQHFRGRCIDNLLIMELETYLSYWSIHFFGSHAQTTYDHKAMKLDVIQFNQWTGGNVVFSLTFN